MFVSTIIWVESVIETVNKRYTVSAGFPTQNGGQSCLATIFADGIVNQVPIVNQCYQIVGNLAPARGDAPARLEITNMFPYTDAANRILSIDIDKVTPLTIFIAGNITLRTNEVISVELSDYSQIEGPVSRKIEISFAHLPAARQGPLQSGKKVICCAAATDVNTYGILNYQIITDGRQNVPGAANPFTSRQGRKPLTKKDLFITIPDGESSPEPLPQPQAKTKRNAAYMKDFTLASPPPSSPSPPQKKAKPLASTRVDQETDSESLEQQESEGEEEAKVKELRIPSGSPNALMEEAYGYNILKPSSLGVRRPTVLKGKRLSNVRSTSAGGESSQKRSKPSIVVSSDDQTSDDHKTSDASSTTSDDSYESE